MSDIADVVFAITARGFATLRSDSNVVSLQHRTVLTMVDGVCPVAQYIPFMRVFAPLEEKFELLERLGCLRRVGTVSGLAVRLFDESLQAGSPVSKLPHIDSEHETSGFVPLASGHGGS
jgi:hypothetical protein